DRNKTQEWPGWPSRRTVVFCHTFRKFASGAQPLGRGVSSVICLLYERRSLAYGYRLCPTTPKARSRSRYGNLQGGCLTDTTSFPPAPDTFPLVGIGASAGGLVALRKFFEHVPANPGVAFVVVVHLSPDNESHLAELLQSSLKIPIQQVTATMRVETDHAYVIPPDANLESIDTHLRLSP